MKPHVLIALNDFTEAQIAQIQDALGDWATCECLPEKTPDQYQTALASAEIVIGWLKAEWLLASPVKFLQLTSVGYDGYIGKDLGDKEGFILSNATGVMSNQVAETCLAMMLALTRRISGHLRDQTQKTWRRRETYEEIQDAVHCVVGLGDIGTEIARRCFALGMRVIGVCKNPDKGLPLVSEIYSVEDIEQAVEKADHVVSILPGGAATEKVFDSNLFARFKTNAYFYNLGRGSTVDEGDLVAALQSGHLAGAGLDVFRKEPLPQSSPLWEMENVIVIPHIGGRSIKEWDRMCDLFVRNLVAYRNGVSLQNVVPK
jgi:D-2-hydroxyacid dehydrogenase (NADP+)